MKYVFDICGYVVYNKNVKCFCHFRRRVVKLTPGVEMFARLVTLSLGFHFSDGRKRFYLLCKKSSARRKIVQFYSVYISAASFAQETYPGGFARTVLYVKAPPL